MNNQNNSLLHDNTMFSLAARDPKQRFALFRIRALALCMACVVGHIVGHIGKIESLEKCTVECEGYQPMASVSSLDSNSARQQQQLDDRHAHSDCDSTWNDFTVKIRDALEGNLPQTSSLPPSDASVVSKLEVYDTMTAD